MKVIDHTPYFSADGKINMIEQVRATMKLGAAWVQETQAQTGVISALNRELDKRFTLLRNVTLKGLEISIPMILVGPSGIYVMYVTPARGMYRAKGDLWGTLSGENFFPATTNLLTRTNRMARAIQVYLQRQGYKNGGTVESALLCADPGLYVDSVRPIVRVVQSDALERYAASIAQARATLNPEVVNAIVNRILNPKSDKAVEPEALSAAPPEPRAAQLIPPSLTTVQPSGAPAEVPVQQPARSGDLVFGFQDDDAPPEEGPIQAPILQAPQDAPQPRAKKLRRKGFSTRQWVLLILVGIIECLLLVILLYLVAQNL